jgi:hypothetical protein
MGEEKKVTKLEPFWTQSCDFIPYLKSKLNIFLTHNLVSRLQDKKFINCLTFPKDVVVSMINFVKNYYFQCQNEIQEMHWFCFKITRLVHIFYCHNLDYLTNPNGNKIIKEYHYYVLDDKDHDTLFVQHCFEL